MALDLIVEFLLPWFHIVRLFCRGHHPWRESKTELKKETQQANSKTKERLSEMQKQRDRGRKEGIKEGRKDTKSANKGHTKTGIRQSEDNKRNVNINIATKKRKERKEQQQQKEQKENNESKDSKTAGPCLGQVSLPSQFADGLNKTICWLPVGYFLTS